MAGVRETVLSAAASPQPAASSAATAKQAGAPGTPSPAAVASPQPDSAARAAAAPSAAERVAFVFAGQGDQFPGMGRELAEKYEAARAVFAMCDDIRPGTSEQCFSGTEDELKITKNTQPCLFAMELAAAEVLRSQGVVPDAVAGFSLGEVTACTFAGAISPEDGFRLVCRRAELMQEAAEAHDTFMAAVVKLGNEEVAALCEKIGDVYPVNFNCPGQVSVAGLSERMPELQRVVREAGGRALPLRVNGAFHSPFMAGAAEAFAETLREVPFQEPKIEIFSDATAGAYDGNFVELLSRQIASPVLWEELVRNLIRGGVRTFVEIGPGRTLTNMIRKIDAGVETRAAADLMEVQLC